MAVDAYLYVDGIMGESTDSSHIGWIDLISHSPPPKTPIAAGGTVSVTKKIDSTSPKLYEAARTGVHIVKVNLDYRTTGGSNQTYATFKMIQVTVSKVSGTGQLAPSPTPALLTETVTFKYASSTTS